MTKLNNGNIRSGRCYILAPENACNGGADWSMFREVWQYGADEIKTKPFLQDGVAPQCEVKGITNLGHTKGGRVYIPDGFEPKGFLKSHSISNYSWIFDINYDPQKPNGYVSKRK